MKHFHIFITVFFFLAVIPSAFTQQCFVDSLMIDNIVEVTPLTVWDEGFGDGPIFYGTCYIKNNTSQNMTVEIKSNMAYYNYHDSCYSSMNDFYHFKKILGLGESIEVEIGGDLMLYSELKESSLIISESSKTIDHTSVLHEIKDSIMIVVYCNDNPIKIKPQKIILKEVFF